MHESSPTLQQTFTHTQTNIQPESTDAETTFVSTSVGTKTSGRPRKKKFNYRHTHTIARDVVVATVGSDAVKECQK
jgi:hypothetical protein